MELILISLIVGAAAHGWMTSPVGNQPLAAGYDLKVDAGGDPSAWYTTLTNCPGHQTTRDCSTNNCPFDCPGEADFIASCGVQRFSETDNTCGLSSSDNPWNKTIGQHIWCDGRRYLGARGQTTWEAGSVVEVAWTIVANHQGASGFRLCPRHSVGRDTGNDGPTEKCFQANHLKYATKETCIQCPANNTVARKCFAANDRTGKNGNIYRESIAHTCTGGHQQTDFCNGKMDYPCFTHSPAQSLHEQGFSLVDKVIVPDLPEGDYVLSWRWDCQRTPQVWMNCADIRVVTRARIAV